MKQIIILILLQLSLNSSAQQKIDEYKDYKACTECLDKFKPTTNLELEKWNKTGLGNYGIAPPEKAKRYISNQVKGVVGVVLGIVVVAVTYSIYNKVNTAASEIH